jgi:hypothetical protein
MANTEIPAQAEVVPVPGQQVLTFRIKSCSVSLDLSSKVYGTGPASYASLNSWIDGATLEQLPDVIDAGMDLFVAAWRMLISAQLATKLTNEPSAEYKALLAKVDKRLLRVKQMLREVPPSQ